MKFKEFLGWGPAGLIAGTVTVLLGGGAVVALAFGNSTPRQRPMGDARLNAGNQAFDAMLVANAGANDVGRVGGSGSGMADGSPVAGPAAAARRAGGAAADGGSSAQSGATTANRAPARPGSAEYYRALLSTGAAGGMGSLAMLPRGAIGRNMGGGNLAGDLTGANAADFTNDRASTVVSDPLVPSRAFSSYGTNDAGSSASSSGSAKKSGSSRPAVGTSPVGPVSNKGASSSLPAASAPLSSPIVNPPASASGSSSNSSANSAGSSSGMPLVSSPSPTVTDPLGQHSTPSQPGGAVNQPDTPPGTTPGTTPPGTKPTPPTTSVVGPDAIVTPEPGTWLLVGSGLLALGLVGRRRASRSN